MSHSVIDLTVPDGSWWFLMFRDPSGVVPRSLCQAPNIPKLCSWWIGSCPTMPEISSNDSTCPEGDFGPSASSQPTSDSTETLLRLYWSCYRSFLHSFPFHMAKVSPTKALPDTVLPPFVFGLFLFEDVQFLHEFCTSSLLGHHLVRLLASTAFALEKHGETVQVRWVRWGWSNIIRNSQISRNSIWNIWKLCSCKAVRINTNLHTFKLPPYSERK